MNTTTDEADSGEIVISLRNPWVLPGPPVDCLGEMARVEYRLLDLERRITRFQREWCAEVSALLPPGEADKAEGIPALPLIQKEPGGGFTVYAPELPDKILSEIFRGLSSPTRKLTRRLLEARLTVCTVGRAAWHALRSMEMMPPELRRRCIVILINASDNAWRWANIARRVREGTGHPIGVQAASYLQYDRYGVAIMMEVVAPVIAETFDVPVIIVDQDTTNHSAKSMEGLVEQCSEIACLLRWLYGMWP